MKTILIGGGKVGSFLALELMSAGRQGCCMNCQGQRATHSSAARSRFSIFPFNPIRV